MAKAKNPAASCGVPQPSVLKAAGSDYPSPNCPSRCFSPRLCDRSSRLVLSSGKRNNLEDFVIVEIERPRLPGPYDRQFDLFPRRLRGIEQVWLAFPVARTILRESLSPHRRCVIFFSFLFLFSRHCRPSTSS